MFRWIFIVLFLVSTYVPQAAAQTPTSAAAKQSFEQLQKQWADLYVQLQKKTPQKGSGSKVDPEIKALTEQIEAMVDKIVTAGLDAHRAGLTNDSNINSTLIAIAGFHVTGDQAGDGGDQYEKALPLIKSMLDAGLGNTAKELWLWGGVSAYCLNDYSLAQQYLLQAQQAGVLGNAPPVRNKEDPKFRVWDSGKKFSESLDATQRAWQKEQQIRAREAASDNSPRVELRTTRGDIVIELFEDEAPIAVANFITLVKQGYYNGLTFHRVLPAFMAQGGDNSQGTSPLRGGPGYTIPCECSSSKARIHFRGSLSMAHAGRNTGGAQFFLTFIPTDHLNGKHTAFGRVLEGMEVAASLKRRDPDKSGPLPTPDKIVSANVIRDRGHEYTFEKLPKK